MTTGATSLVPFVGTFKARAFLKRETRTPWSSTDVEMCLSSMESDTSFGVEERKESDGARQCSVEEGRDRGDLWVWPCEEWTREKSPGPCIGEGGLATTHFLIHNVSCGAPSPRRKWTITSTDTNQILHALLAMASGFLAPDGANRVDVTVRRRHSKVLGDFLLVNRLYEVVCNNSAWVAPSHPWLTNEAKVVVYVLVYLLGGCNFLPAMHSMTFERMLPYAMVAVSEGGLFKTPLVEKDNSGKWIVQEEAGIKLMATCYFRLHSKIFESADKSASEFFQDCDRRVDTYLDRIRFAILRVHGRHSKQACPAWDALELQVKRASTVLAYWQAAFDDKMVIPEFQNNGWAMEPGKHDERLNMDNVVIQLSKNATLNKAGKVKILSCSCKVEPLCISCSCRTRGASCTPGYCACALKCVAGRKGRVPQFNDGGGAGTSKGVDLEPSSDGDSDGSDNDACFDGRVRRNT